MVNRKRLIFDCDTSPWTTHPLALVDHPELRSGGGGGRRRRVCGNVSVDQSHAQTRPGFSTISAWISRWQRARQAPEAAAGPLGEGGTAKTAWGTRPSARLARPGGSNLRAAVNFISAIRGLWRADYRGDGPAAANITLAFQKNREVVNRIRELIMMGGAVAVPEYGHHVGVQLLRGPR